jgi:hypothetical protein
VGAEPGFETRLLNTEATRRITCVKKDKRYRTAYKLYYNDNECATKQIMSSTAKPRHSKTRGASNAVPTVLYRKEPVCRNNRKTCFPKYETETPETFRPEWVSLFVSSPSTGSTPMQRLSNRQNSGQQVSPLKVK